MNEILPRFLSVAWYAVMAPPHTPQALATQISSDLKAILSSASIGARFNDLSCEPMGTSPEQALAQIREDTKRWRNVIHTAGARVD
jgi:tripartite-type tricarboxylate transporter receptor subunit TctC